MKFKAILAGALLVGGGVAMAQEDNGQQEGQEAVRTAVPAAQVESTEPDEEDPGEEVICRTERITGSLVRRRRTCMTRHEWAELERASAQGHNETIRGASGSQCIPDNPTTGRC